MLASIAEREQFRSLSAAKVRKIIQKTAFGEDINTISVHESAPSPNDIGCRNVYYCRS